ncbi:MAG: VPLPA-CTERM sorting domain-containing protein [Pseudomonadota bacterium]
MMKRLLCAAALIATLPSLAAAIPVKWDVSGTIFSGETVFDPVFGFATFVSSGVADTAVSGSFVFDADTQTFSDIDITVDGDNSIATSLGGFFDYDTSRGGATFGFGNGVDTTTSSRVLYFGAEAPLTNAGGSLSSTASFSFPGVTLLAFGDVSLNGTAVPLAPVPVPAGLPLLLAGLGAIAVLRTRRKA